VARDFDGSADYLVSSTLPVTAYPFTFACWANVDNNSAGHLVGLTDNTDTTRLSIFFINGGQLAAACVDDISVNRDWRTTATGATGVWHSCVGVFTSATDYKAFLNGDSTGSYAFTGNAAVNSANRFNIGALLRSSLAGQVDGRIAEVGVWNVALTQAEVDMLAAGHSPMMVRPQSLVGYWPLHGRGGASGNEESWVSSHDMGPVSAPALADHPRIIYPGRRSIWLPTAAANQTIAIGLVAETDTALAITALKTLAIGLTSETDESQAIAWSPKNRFVGLATETDEALAMTVVGGTAPVVTPTEQPSGGWLGRRKRWEPPEPPSAEEVQRERERLGILPAKTRKAAEKIAEREIANAAADNETMRQTYAEVESGELKRRVERSIRNELATKRQSFRPELPQIVQTIILDGLSRLRDTHARNRAAEQEEQEVHELLEIWMDM
jgi:hypothetical protein